MTQLIQEDSLSSTYYNFQFGHEIHCIKSTGFPLYNESWPSQTEQSLKSCKRLRKLTVDEKKLREERVWDRLISITLK